MRTFIGTVLAVVAGAALGYGIATTVTTARGCVSADCLPGVESGIPLIIGGTIAFFVAVALWWASWLIAPVVGLATAAGVMVADGTAIDPGSALLVSAAVLLGPAVLAVVAVRGRGKQQLATRLVQTGQRGVAHVQGAQETGVRINDRPQVRVSYLIQPLDGSPTFAHSKTQTLGATDIPPRPGLAWPAWYDPADQSKVAVGTPSGGALDPQTEATLREFGITFQQAYGYDPGAPRVIDLADGHSPVRPSAIGPPPDWS